MYTYMYVRIHICTYTRKFNFNTRLEDRGSCYAHIPNCKFIPAGNTREYIRTRANYG